MKVKAPDTGVQSTRIELRNPKESIVGQGGKV